MCVASTYCSSSHKTSLIRSKSVIIRMWKFSCSKWNIDFYTHEQPPGKGNIVWNSQCNNFFKVSDKEATSIGELKIIESRNWTAADSSPRLFVAAFWQQYLISSLLYLCVFKARLRESHSIKKNSCPCLSYTKNHIVSFLKQSLSWSSLFFSLCDIVDINPWFFKKIYFIVYYKDTYTQE